MRTRDIDDFLHERLYKDLIKAGFSHHQVGSGKVEKRYVCLTGPESQRVRRSKRIKTCIILYGPNMNYDGEEGEVHCRKDFWDDIVDMEKRGKIYHPRAYELLEQAMGLLKPIVQTRRPDWVFCKVTDWRRFSSLIRSFNQIQKDAKRSPSTSQAALRKNYQGL